MKNLSLLFVTIILLQLTSLAQAPNIEWAKTFGGVGYDEGNVIIETDDNGFIVGGGTNDNSGIGYSTYSYLIKLNNTGDKIWTSTSCYGEYGWEKIIHNLYELNTGDYIMGFDGTNNGMLQVNTNGVSVKYYWLNYPSRQGPFLNNMCKTYDGNYALSYRCVFGCGLLQKVDNIGNEIWNKCFVGFYTNYVIQTYEGGFAFAGDKWDAFAGRWFGLLLGKTNSDGDTLWTKVVYKDSVQPSSSIKISSKCLEQATDGGYLILGNETQGNIKLLRTNELGDTLWTKKYGGGGIDYGEHFTQTPDDGYIIVGSTESFGVGDSDVWLIKLDSLGNTQWTKTIGGSEDDYGKYVQVTSDGGYIVTGSTYSYGQGESDVWVIRLAPDPLLDFKPNNNIVISDYRLAQNFPNPFNPNTTIKYQIPKLSYATLKVYDVLGSEITTLVNEEKQIGTYKITWLAENFPSGVYFYRIQSGNYIETKKMILLK